MLSRGMAACCKVHSMPVVYADPWAIHDLLSQAWNHSQDLQQRPGAAEQSAHCACTQP